MSAVELTAGEVAVRLGVKASMVRRYAAALETVTGISLQVDPVRGRLYPLQAVEVLEAARAHLLAHPGGSVEGALRAVTGEGAGEVPLPARVPGTITPDDLRAALEGVLSPVLAELQAQRLRGDALAAEVQALRSHLAQLPSPEPDLSPLLAQVESLGGEVGALRAEVAHLTPELQAARSAVERLEVMTHAALSVPQPERVPLEGKSPFGLWGILARFLGVKRQS